MAMDCRCLLILVMLSLLFPGCGKRETRVEAGIREQVLYIGNGAEPETLDPHLASGIPEYAILSALFEGLVTEHPQTLEPEPGAAKRWEMSDDGKRYTFYLREEGRWSNGDPVIAADFVFSFQRALSPELGARYAYLLQVIRNARSYCEGRITDFGEVGVHALDERTLVVELGFRVPYFLSLLSHNICWPVHRRTVIGQVGSDERRGDWTRPGKLVGNGPFVLTKWQVNQEVVVTRNPYYWEAQHVRLSAIHFSPIDSAETEERAFRGGMLHITNTLPLSLVDSYRRDRPRVVRFDPYLGTYFIRLNTMVPPLDNVHVRRALALAVDREAITRFVTRAGQEPAGHFTPPGVGSYEAESRQAFDPARGRELLAQAGYADGAELPAIELTFNTSESHRRIAEALQQMWKEHLGIEVRLHNQEWKSFLNSVENLDYSLSRASWIGDYRDPSTFLDIFTSESGNNRTGWKHANYDALVEAAQRTAPGKSRDALFQRAERLLLDEAPIIPIYFYVRSLLIHPSVRGWHPNILDRHPYKYVYLE